MMLLKFSKVFLRPSRRNFGPTRLLFKEDFEYPLKEYLQATENTCETIGDKIQEIFDEKKVKSHQFM